MYKAVPYIADEHYDVAAKWWKDHKWKNLPPKDYLPTDGIVVLYGNKPVAMAWLFLTSNAKSAWLHFLVSDRSVDKVVRNLAIDYVIENCCMLAKGLGYNVIWACTKFARSKKRYLDLGFIEGDTNTTHYIKGL